MANKTGNNQTVPFNPKDGPGISFENLLKPQSPEQKEQGKKFRRSV